jgi:hypothetical protein
MLQSGSADKEDGGRACDRALSPCDNLDRRPARAQYDPPGDRGSNAVRAASKREHHDNKKQ